MFFCSEYTIFVLCQLLKGDLFFCFSVQCAHLAFVICLYLYVICIIKCLAKGGRQCHQHRCVLLLSSRLSCFPPPMSEWASLWRTTCLSFTSFSSCPSWVWQRLQRRRTQGLCTDRLFSFTHQNISSSAMLKRAMWSPIWEEYETASCDLWWKWAHANIGRKWWIR